MVADILCSMPLAQIEPLLKEKELITGSAVDYLREQGVLK